MTKLKDLLVAGAVLALGRRRSPRRPRGAARIVAPGAPDRRAENAVLILFFLATLAAAAFIVAYALDRLGRQTQWLGLSIGLAFCLLAVACIVIAHRLVVTEELVHEYPEPEHPEEQSKIEQIVDESGSRFTRKRLVTLAGAGALGTLGLAALTPAASLGPVLDTSALYRTPWRRGRRLVDEAGKPLSAADVEEEAFYTAFPEGADRELMGSPVVVVRLASREIVAYSKICTHAGCAIALYRKPTFAPTQPKPALVCPCHYSTFDPADRGKVLFGPAGRALPQLPLLVDGAGNLRAAGNFSGPVGPSWSGVRQGPARS
ncbi:MAG: ubiquinol-cytochrome c reductase iron-sulfur subunit [Gaiellaceae bacterium]